MILKNISKFWLIRFCLSCLFISLTVSIAHAHQPNKVFQATLISLKRPLITIQYETTYGEVLAKVNVIRADTNKDGQLSKEEKSKFLKSKSKEILSKITPSIDGNKKELRYSDGQLNISSTQHMTTQLIFELPVEDLNEGQHEFFLIDDNFPETVLGDMYFAVYAGKGSKTLQVSQNNNSLTWNILYDMNLPGDPVSQNTEGLQGVMDGTKDQSEGSRLSQLLEQKNLNPWFIFLALLIAAGMGALHALGPGHGKAMVAAYLIGEKGTVRDAVILGSIVTLTHVSSVILLGIVVLVVSEFFLPQQLYPWLGIVSGVIIFLVGFWMLARRTLINNSEHPHDHKHGDSHPPQEKVNLSSLLLLGISGGMVPCPAALVVLLAAIAMHRIIFGLSLIFAFSVGLAVVLILIGILVIKSTKFMLKSKTEAKWIRILPVLSACIIMLIGIGIVLNALLSAGIINVNFGL